MSASSVKMKMELSFTITSQMDPGAATMELVLIESMVMGTMAMTVRVIISETMDMGTITRRRLKIGDKPTAGAEATLSCYLSESILSQLRSENTFVLS